MDTLTLGDATLEYAWHGAPAPAASASPVGGSASPALVFLHEGLGSLGLWRDFPAAAAAATGRRALVYSRAGHGNSSPVPLPRPLTYMHDEARVLPDLLDALGVADAVLVGHSDGASIALIHAGSGDPRAARVRGLVLLAPHVFVEELTLASIRAARDAYAHRDLRARLARWHAHVDVTFRGWNDAWLDPGFRTWDLTSYLPHVTAPALLIQGADDEYGTLAQLSAIEHGLAAPTTRLVLPACRHSPHRDQPAATLAALASFVASIC